VITLGFDKDLSFLRMTSTLCRKIIGPQEPLAISHAILTSVISAMLSRTDFPFFLRFADFGVFPAVFDKHACNED
jgi:hypothetical protein